MKFKRDRDLCELNSLIEKESGVEDALHQKTVKLAEDIFCGALRNDLRKSQGEVRAMAASSIRAAHIFFEELGNIK